MAYWEASRDFVTNVQAQGYTNPNKGTAHRRKGKKTERSNEFCTTAFPSVKQRKREKVRERERNSSIAGKLYFCMALTDGIMPISSAWHTMGHFSPHWVPFNPTPHNTHTHKKLKIYF